MPLATALVAGGVALVVALAGGWLAHGQGRPPHAAGALLVAPAAAPPAGLPASALAGTWRGRDGLRIVVAASGAVWSDSGQMQGRLKAVAVPDANLVFGDDRFFCAYAVTFRAPDAAAWRLVGRSLGTPCPSGSFERPFSP